MGNMFGNSLRIAAATAALAIPTATANAETMPTQADQAQSLEQTYTALTNNAEAFAAEHQATPTNIGTVAVTRGRVVFSGGRGTGSVLEIQADAYDKPSRTLQEAVISIYTPDCGAGDSTSTTMPNSLFQITLMKGKNNRAEAPKTPAGFSRAINRAAGKTALGEYNFNLGKQPDGSWQVTAAHSKDSAAQVFSTDTTGPSSYPETSAAHNFEDVSELLAQASRTLKAVESGAVLKTGRPVNLRPRHTA